MIYKKKKKLPKFVGGIQLTGKTTDIFEKRRFKIVNLPKIK